MTTHTAHADIDCNVSWDVYQVLYFKKFEPEISEDHDDHGDRGGHDGVSNNRKGETDTIYVVKLFQRQIEYTYKRSELNTVCVCSEILIKQV